jgi:hypothetical protein
MAVSSLQASVICYSSISWWRRRSLRIVRPVEIVDAFFVDRFSKVRLFSISDHVEKQVGISRRGFRNIFSESRRRSRTDDVDEISRRWEIV